MPASTETSTPPPLAKVSIWGIVSNAALMAAARLVRTRTVVLVVMPPVGIGTKGVLPLSDKGVGRGRVESCVCVLVARDAKLRSERCALLGMGDRSLAEHLCVI